jgi:hypothetical protein
LHVLALELLYGYPSSRYHQTGSFQEQHARDCITNEGKVHSFNNYNDPELSFKCI